MQYQLANVITAYAKFQQNQDGSIKASGVQVQTKIVGAYAGKFIQTDTMPPFNLPANGTNADNEAYIQAQAAAFVAATYPNT